MNWQLAYERSEMLRHFQTDLLTSMGHQLRSAPTTQLNALQMVLGNFCDSEAEQQEYLQLAQHSITGFVRLLEECVSLIEYPLPIQMLRHQPVNLGSLLQNTYRLTYLRAKDRRITYTWPAFEPWADQWVGGDPHGLLHAWLGLCGWSLDAVITGEILCSLECRGQAITVIWRCIGQLTIPAPSAPRDRYWRVAEALIVTMGGSLTQETFPGEQVISCGLAMAPTASRQGEPECIG